MKQTIENDPLSVRIRRTVRLFVAHPIRGSQAKRMVWQLKHFRHTAHGRYLQAICNRNLGESCFIIGNGPSLTAADLQILHEQHIDSFATNRIFRIFPQTDWRPTYFINTDPVLIRDVLDEVNAIPAKEKFFSMRILQNKDFCKKVRDYHLFSIYFKPGTEEFSLDCTDKIRGRGCVTISAIQLAAHMGYRRIYLLGVDHSFTSETDEISATTTTATSKARCATTPTTPPSAMPTHRRSTAGTASSSKTPPAPRSWRCSRKSALRTPWRRYRKIPIKNKNLLQQFALPQEVPFMTASKSQTKSRNSGKRFPPP